jgi:nucleoside-diphosphate-sugar epimerase
MAVLVTGGSGFLGGRLAQMLADRGDTVRVLARPGNDLRHLEGPRFEIIQGSLSDIECMTRAVRGVTHIYHCAGCSTDWAPWSVYHQANVVGVQNLLRAAITLRAATAGSGPDLQRFLHVSTTDVYGYPRTPCEESHPLVETKLPYNRSKCMGEAAVWDAARDHGLPVTVVRPATIYGPRGTAFATDIARLIRQGLMAVIDGGRSKGGFCYVDNAAQAIIQAATARETVGRAYNLADGTGATWRTYVNALADGLGERRPWIDLPSTVAFPLARMMEAPHHLRIPGRPLLTVHAVYLLSRSQEYPIERARREFGLAPQVSFEEGIARTIQWLSLGTPIS